MEPFKHFLSLHSFPFPQNFLIWTRLHVPFLYPWQSPLNQILHGVSMSIMFSGSLLMLPLLVMTGFSALTKLYSTLFAHFSEISTRKLPVGLSVWIHQLAPSQNIKILALKLLFYLSQLWHCLQFQWTPQHVLLFLLYRWLLTPACDLCPKHQQQQDLCVRYEFYSKWYFQSIQKV